ncbi:MAG: L-2-amino-thiazoline-4-carboxylic acid hydrolase, partial [Candidatus Thorarchaeota archaeon]
AEDLGKIMLCEGDHPFIKTMNPNLKLERTKTLMEGNEQCNHRFFWDE